MPTIWRIPLTTPLPASLPLSASEQARADRFRFPRDAHRYRVAHWALRDILAQATGVPAEALEFRIDPTGKPHLAHKGAPQFNLSHAHDLALLAVGDATDLGVDVEYHRPVPEMRGVAESHFAEEERAALFGSSQHDDRAGAANNAVHRDGSHPDNPAITHARLETFYRIWTRKEAFVKATGSGVGPALARFAVTADPHDARILRADDYPAATTDWTLRDLGLAPPYTGALVVCGPASAVKLHAWVPPTA